jgi:hypothetical protein
MNGIGLGPLCALFSKREMVMTPLLCHHRRSGPPTFVELRNLPMRLFRAAAPLCLLSVVLIGAANADPTIPCSIIEDQCPIDTYPMNVDPPPPGDPCSEPECGPNPLPVVPRLMCHVQTTIVNCEAWPRTAHPLRPFTYRWSGSGAVSGGTKGWVEQPTHSFQCDPNARVLGLVELEVKTPYGMTSATSLNVTCIELAGAPLVPHGNPPTLPIGDPIQ